MVNKQTASLDNENQILANQANQISLLTALVAQTDVLNNNVANAVNLMELVVQGLGNVATLDVQNQELVLLNAILQNQSLTRARHIVLDVAHAHHAKQIIPTASGP